MNFQLILCAVTLCWVLVLCGVALSRTRLLAFRLSFAVALLLPASHDIIDALMQTSAISSSHTFWHSVRCVIVAMMPAPWIVLSLCYARGNPTQELQRWRVPILISLLVPLLPLIWFEEAFSPKSWEPEIIRRGILVLDWPGKFAHLCLVIGSVLALTNLERTFRASAGTMRWRIKYAVIGLGGLFAVHLYTGSQAVLYSAVQPWFDSLESWALMAACLCLSVALFRSENIAADLYPSREALYGSIVIAVAGGYLFVVGVLGKIATVLGGKGNLPLQSFLILIGLLVATSLALSDRFRLLTKQFVSRHFKRPIYDYRTLWRKFSETIASCHEPHELSRAAIRTVSTSVSPPVMSLMNFPVQRYEPFQPALRRCLCPFGWSISANIGSFSGHPRS